MLGVVGASAAAGLVPGLAGPAHAAAATIVVDASKRQGTFFNPGWYVNHTHPNWYFSKGLLPASTLRQLREDFNVRWARVVVRAENFFDPDTGAYDFARNYPYIDQAASYANRLLLNFVSSTSMRKTPQLWEKLMYDTLLDHKARYPKIDSVMPWIEPNLGIVGGHPDKTAMTPKEFYPFYAAGYRAVQAVNDRMKPAVPLTYGGPTTSNLPEAWLAEFLKLYAADTDARKRLDFLSVQLYHKNRDNPRQALTHRTTLRTLLREAGLNQYLPPYVTEYGIYGGAETGETGGRTPAQDLAHDQLVQACGVAALGRYYIESGMNRPFHWVVHHGENLRKDMFVEGKDGVRLPFGHVVVMQGMLKDAYDNGERVATTITPDGSATNGLGIGAIAHVDSGQLTLMYWNYQAELGTRTYDAKLVIRNLPRSLFSTSRIRVESWLVDATNNNYNYNGTTEFARNAIFRMDRPTEFKRMLPLTKNAIGLLRITPAT
ncbi:MAG TPA: hypothetical protein VKZ82_14720 [Nonomuraea sp.]|nr:hypothetical protein [Nonomuraea sp.]